MGVLQRECRKKVICSLDLGELVSLGDEHSIRD